MRTKLILLLIFSSLTSLSYSQKLTQEDFQGLWYRISDRQDTKRLKSNDSLYNLIREENITTGSYREAFEEIDSSKNSDSSIVVPKTLLQEIKVLTGGYGAQYSLSLIHI